MTALLSYLPEDRAHALTRGATLPSRTHGAVLFADISGFTPLTEALTHAHGPRTGIEALTEQINRVYGGLTSAVARWRGSVISFSGDAITCWFDDADGPAAPRAAACALALQAAMASFAAIALPGGRVTTLALKVAVATGFARRFVVGDPAIQLLDVLAGSLLERVAAGEHLARPGEILLDEITLVALGAAAQSSEQRRDPESGAWFSLLSALTVLPQASPWEPLDLPAAAIRPWIAGPVWERELAGLGAFITELRRVVALFARFDGIDFDADDTAEARLDVLIRRAQAVIVDTGGTLLQLTVGDKGAYLYAAFGAPIAHEDDARRAARAALALHAIAVELGLPPLQIGLSQGVVRTGAYGGPARRTYGALGDEVNVAARLMQAAPPGATLATSRVRSLAGDTLSWEPLPDLVLKGKAQPIAVYRLQSLRADAPTLQRHLLTAQHMIGRARELAELEAVLDVLAETRGGRTVVIEGEPGLGKSQLVASVLGAAHRRGVRALVGGGDGVEQATPAFAWRPIFGQLLGLSVLATDLPAQRQYVGHQLRAAGEDEDLAPLLNLVVPLGFPETPATSPLAGAARAEQTAELLLRLLRRAAEAEPLLIVLEDIHWLDPTSWELLHQLSAAQLAVLVLTTRPPELDTYEQYGPLLATPETRWISLHPLAADELVPLLCAQLGAAQIAPEVAALILERADGNPYFSVELAIVLRELGLVRVEAGVCQFALGRQHESMVLPDTLQGLIGYRLDRLAPEEQLTVKVASVIGRVFAAQTLRAVHPLTPEPKHLYDQLTAVEQLNLVVREMPAPELRYAFRHIIAQEAIYSLLTTELQRSLHAAVARWLEEAYAADKGPYALLLAYHWQRADEPARARDYLDMGGAQALRDGAYREARELLEQAAVLEAKHAALGEPEAAALLRKVRRNSMLAEANHGLDGPTRALPYLQAALALVGHTLPRSPIGLAAGSVVQLLRLAAHELHRSEAAGRKLDTRLATELAEVYWLYSLIAFIDNDTLTATYTGCWFIVLALESGTPVQRARAAAGANILFTMLFLPGVAALYNSRANALIAQSDASTARGYVEQVLGSTAIGQARWKEGIQRLRTGEQISRQLQDSRTWGEATVTLGLAHYFLGEFAPATEAFKELAAIGGERGSLEQQAYGHNGLGMVALREGRAAEALAQLERAAELLEQSNELRIAKQMNYGARAMLYARLDRQEEARQLARRIAQATGLLPQTLPHGIDGLIGWAEVALQLSGSRNGSPDARRAVAALRRFALFYPMGRPAAWRYRGRLAWQDGKAETALRAWRHSLAEAQRLGMPYDEGQAHAELGLHLPPGHSAHHEHLVRAIAILSRLGARPDLERVICAAVGWPRITSP